MTNCLECGEIIGSSLSCKTLLARIAELETENEALLGLTHALLEHPEGYDGPCECRVCLSYATNDDPHV